MTVPAILMFAIYTVVVLVVGFALNWISEKYAPPELAGAFRAAIIAIVIFLILLRLYLLSTM